MQEDGFKYHSILLLLVNRAEKEDARVPVLHVGPMKVLIETDEILHLIVKSYQQWFVALEWGCWHSNIGILTFWTRTGGWEF